MVVCTINSSGDGCGSQFCNGIYLRLFCMYGTHFYSGPIGMFCIIIFFYSKSRYMGLTLQYINPIEVLQYPYKGWKSKKKMGLSLQYINPIEVLQYQYKGSKSGRYHIQIVGFTHHNSAMI